MPRLQVLLVLIRQATAAATVRFGVVFWAGTRLLHRKRKTHARVDSVASLETMISTTPRAPAAGEALEKVFPTTFSGPREVDRKTDFEPGSGMREGCSGMAFTALGSGPRGVGHSNSIVSEYIYPSAKAFRDSDRRRSPNRGPQGRRFPSPGPKSKGRTPFF